MTPADSLYPLSQQPEIMNAVTTAYGFGVLTGLVVGVALLMLVRWMRA